MAVKPIPEGYQSVTPYLIVKGAAQAVVLQQADLTGLQAEVFRNTPGQPFGKGIQRAACQ